PRINNVKMGTGPSLLVEDVVFEYPGGVRALDGLSLRVGSGERAALLGTNGAGKTTLARHLNGLLVPVKGSVRVNGEAPTARRVGCGFQNPDDRLFGRAGE